MKEMLPSFCRSSLSKVETLCIVSCGEDKISGHSEWLQGPSAYYIQCYKDSGHILHPGLTAPSEEKMHALRDAALPNLPNTYIRGM